MNTITNFFSKIRAFFSFFKKGWVIIHAWRSPKYASLQDRSSHRSCSVKKVFLKISQISQKIPVLTSWMDLSLTNFMRFRVEVKIKALSKYYLNRSFPVIQKQPSIGVLIKRCSENMQQIYLKTPMPKCDFTKVAK